MDDLTDEQMEMFREEERIKRRGFRVNWAVHILVLPTRIHHQRRGWQQLSISLMNYSTPLPRPYDFAVLCTVTAKSLTHKFPEGKAAIDSAINRCRALNDDRVRIAHGACQQLFETSGV